MPRDCLPAAMDDRVGWRKRGMEGCVCVCGGGGGGGGGVSDEVDLVVVVVVYSIEDHNFFTGQLNLTVGSGQFFASHFPQIHKTDHIIETISRTRAAEQADM